MAPQLLQLRAPTPPQLQLLPKALTPPQLQLLPPPPRTPMGHPQLHPWTPTPLLLSQHHKTHMGPQLLLHSQPQPHTVNPHSLLMANRQIFNSNKTIFIYDSYLFINKY